MEDRTAAGQFDDGEAVGVFDVEGGKSELLLIPAQGGFPVADVDANHVDRLQHRVPPGRGDGRTAYFGALVSGRRADLACPLPFGLGISGDYLVNTP